MAKILVVEDSPDILDMITALLETNNHEVISAGEAEGAWDILDEHQFDLVLCDLCLPV